MTTYGLTADGFVPKTLEIIREEINENIRVIYGTSIDLSDSSALGQIVGIFAEREALLWELAEQVNSSQDPDSASGARLHAIGALTGISPLAATPSTVTLTLTGTPATVIPSGSSASTSSTEISFVTVEDATLPTNVAWTITTAYIVGDLVTNSGKMYQCITAGTSAGAGGPTTTAADITDGTVHWTHLGTGTGATTVEAATAATGPTIAIARDITVIDTPVSGWNGVINLLDADPGRDEETDAEFRVRREISLSASGTSTQDAIRADLLAVADVVAVTVFVNNTDATDGDGVPPHAIEALVRGGDDQDIWDQLLASVAAGIATYGAETGTATDSQGVAHTMNFSRPDEILIWVKVTLTYDATLYPTDGDAQVEAAIVAWGDAQATGKNSVASAITAQAFTVAGVLDVSATLIGLADPPVASTTIAISLRELAVYDTSRITILSSSGTP